MDASSPAPLRVLDMKVRIANTASPALNQSDPGSCKYSNPTLWQAAPGQAARVHHAGRAGRRNEVAWQSNPCSAGVSGKPVSSAWTLRHASPSSPTLSADHPAPPTLACPGRHSTWRGLEGRRGQVAPHGITVSLLLGILTSGPRQGQTPVQTRLPLLEPTHQQMSSVNEGKQMALSEP